jgi:Kef-type K+ transport system membrane component KefB
MNINILDTTTTGLSGEPYEILIFAAAILALSKLFSILCGKIHIPQVIGYLIAGLVVGLLSFTSWGKTELFGDTYVDAGLSVLAKIGVVLILFSAGVETDLKQIKAVGGAAMVITSLGVLVPLALGFLAAYLFHMGDDLVTTVAAAQNTTEEAYLAAHPGFNYFSDVYYGVILSATSVSITVATLKELHRLETPVGSAIVSAAIIDDVIGIILLSLVISLAGGKGSITYVADNTTLNILAIIGVMASFFVLSWLLGFVVRKVFNYLGTKYPHHIRIPIFALAFCFAWAYVAQKFFNIADITGGYVAGLMLSATMPKEYIDQRTEQTANILFVPLFFASVAMKMYTAQIDFSNLNFLWFGFAWIFAGLIGKVIGAGSGALMCKFSLKDSLRIGIGMMARAEVLIVCAQTGVDAGLVDQKIIPFTLGLILLSSFLTPILLKVSFKGEPDPTLPSHPETVPASASTSSTTNEGK